VAFKLTSKKPRHIVAQQQLLLICGCLGLDMIINSHWVLCHVTMGLFEPTNTFGITMATQVKDLLLSYNLLDKFFKICEG
jgi:hypothetical protein